MTLPALEAVRENFPKSRITVIARPWVAPVFENHPAVNNILIYNRHDKLPDNISEIWVLINKIRKNRYDLAVLFQNAFEAALIMSLAELSHGSDLILTGGDFC